MIRFVHVINIGRQTKKQFRLAHLSTPLYCLTLTQIYVRNGSSALFNKKHVVCDDERCAYASHALRVAPIWSPIYIYIYEYLDCVLSAPDRYVHIYIPNQPNQTHKVLNDLYPSVLNEENSYTWVSRWDIDNIYRTRASSGHKLVRSCSHRSKMEWGGVGYTGLWNALQGFQVYKIWLVCTTFYGFNFIVVVVVTRFFSFWRSDCRYFCTLYTISACAVWCSPYCAADFC